MHWDVNTKDADPLYHSEADKWGQHWWGHCKFPVFVDRRYFSVLPSNLRDSLAAWIRQGTQGQPVRSRAPDGRGRRQNKGDERNGGWLRSHVEAPTREALTRLYEKPSCASSSLSSLTHLRKLAPHFTHIEPSTVSHPPVVACPRGQTDASRRFPI